MAMLHGQKIPKEEWDQLRSKLAESLAVSEEKLKPGMPVGMPSGELHGKIRHAINQPMRGFVWVVPTVVAALREINATGIEYNEVELTLMGRPGQVSTTTPRLWELSVTGHAWRYGMPQKRSYACEACGRMQFPCSWYLRVDETKWTGTDFFNLDMNPVIVMVTERIKQLFEQRSFGNCRFVPADETADVPID